MQKLSSVKTRVRGGQLGVVDSTHSAGFQPVRLDAVASISPPAVHCAPEDFALEVVAPVSAIREPVAMACGLTAMSAPRVRWWASGSAANAPNLFTPLRPQLPGMVRPAPAALFASQWTRPGVRYRLASLIAQPGWPRWAALAVCFVAIATVTNFIVFRRSEQASASATQFPAASFEDFTAGFSRWDGAEGGPKPWTLEPGRGAMPNSLALFKPSTGMTSYRLEFSGDVMKNGISWAVRARDPQNYEGLQITERKRGAELQLWFTRYKVIAGKEGPRTQVPLQILLPAQSLWLVRMETIGDNSTLWIENQIANSWSEPAIGTGGGSIGFFAGRGDQYMLRKVRITPQ